MLSLVSALPSARGCGDCAMRPSGVTRRDSFSTPRLPPCRTSGSPLLMSAARVRSNVLSMAALMGPGILPAGPSQCNQSAERLTGDWRAAYSFGLTNTSQVGEELRQLAFERGAREPVRDERRWIDGDLVTQQCARAFRQGLEQPRAFVGLEIAAHLPEIDGMVGDQLRAEYIFDGRRIP